MRIAVAGFLHETNTFNPITIARADFEAQGLASGPAMLREWADAHHEVGGFLAGASRFSYEAVPLGMAWGTPSGPVDQAFFDEWVGHLASSLFAAEADGLLLALHGAMVTTGVRDADAEVLTRLRARVGDDFPIAVTFDLHGNLSPRLPSLVRIATSYRTNPHIDQRETGLRAASLLVRWLKGEITPHLAISKPPLIVNIMRHDSSEEPFAGVLRRCREMEKSPGVHVVDFLPAFAYADVEEMGPSFIVTANDDFAAEEVAEVLGAELWEARASFQADLPGKAEAVRRAIASTRPPAVIVETGDNVGGGSPGDSTEILGELLRQGATGWVVMLHAPEAVKQCRLGAEVSLAVGTPSVEVSGRVRLMHDGTYTETQVRHGGKRENHMGPTALVESAAGGLLALTTLRHPPFSLVALTCLGIEPAKMRILVVKAAIAYKAAYRPVAGEIIEAATAGLTCIDPRAFTYRHARRLYPLDAPAV